MNYVMQRILDLVLKVRVSHGRIFSMRDGIGFEKCKNPNNKQQKQFQIIERGEDGRQKDGVVGGRWGSGS